jgi:hypothetical protein
VTSQVTNDAEAEALAEKATHSEAAEALQKQQQENESNIKSWTVYSHSQHC